MDEQKLWLDLATSLGLGLLVGLQRERVGSPLAGIRTFPLITLAGTVGASLAPPVNAWVLAAGLLAIVGIAAIGNSGREKSDRSPGVTTECAMALMFLVGAFVAMGPREGATAVGAACAVLLYAKPILHTFSSKLDETDIRAIMQFAVISLIILPIAPDEGFGPYGVINPQKVWLLVVLIVSISLAAYVAYRLVGDHRGALLGGLLGGLISSTATTVSFSRRASGSRGAEKMAALAILVASSVLCVRLLVVIWAVARAHYITFAWPIGVLLGASVVSAFLARLAGGKDSTPMPRQTNPTQLKAALAFAALFCVVLVLTEWGRRQFGNAGTYVIAFVAGLTDLDAIALTTGRTVSSGEVTPVTGVRAILVAFVANTIFKTGIAGVLGSRGLMVRVGTLSLIPVGAAVALFILIPRFAGA